jgi:hypothetical protein
MPQRMTTSHGREYLDQSTSSILTPETSPVSVSSKSSSSAWAMFLFRGVPCSAAGSMAALAASVFMRVTKSVFWLQGTEAGVQRV